MKGLTILPVKPTKEAEKLKKKRKKLHPFLPNIYTGQLLIIVSPVKTGKSTIISNLILNKDFYKNKFDTVYVISPTIHIDETSRFLKEKYQDTVFDKYSDDIINEIIEYQETFSKKDMPRICIVIDDFIGIGSSSAIWNLSSRFRHYNIGLLIFATQKFRALPVIVRSNATSALFLAPNPNHKELLKIAEEFGSIFGGEEEFLKLYEKATKLKYSFLNLDLESNPPIAYESYHKKIYEGKNL
jgi:hypothetical protein